MKKTDAAKDPIRLVPLLHYDYNKDYDDLAIKLLTNFKNALDDGNPIIIGLVNDCCTTSFIDLNNTSIRKAVRDTKTDMLLVHDCSCAVASHFDKYNDRIFIPWYYNSDFPFRDCLAHTYSLIGAARDNRKLYDIIRPYITVPGDLRRFDSIFKKYL